MPFIPHTPEEIERMLAVIGIDSLDDLFSEIPANLRIDALDLDPPRSEFEATAFMSEIAARNRTTRDYDSYLGGGSYEHFIPAATSALAMRGEFSTAYTPYQAEASQGTLQAIYEFQSMICALTGLDVANASLYDGASAVAEAVLMAVRTNRRQTVLVPASLHPHYRDVLRTYTHNLGVRMVELPMCGAATDAGSLASLDAAIAKDTTAVIIPVTNFFGEIEPWREMAAWAAEHKALAIAVANPMSLAALEAPGAWGADICVGEAQPFGLPTAWGGPYAGFMACKEQHIRKMPGRIVGCTTDDRGQRGYVLTLQTREQHIRRDKATSNICTNQGLCALHVTIALALLGRVGIERLGRLNLERAATLREALLAIEGIEAFGSDQFFNEFSVRLPMPAAEFVAAMRERGILAGLTAKGYGDEFADVLIVCATETKTRAHFERYAAAARAVVAAATVSA
jgi:glycine dehydrogenase subunit 1